MTSKEFEVLKNIIGAIETGGQVYGNQNYACYVPPYKNTPEEHTCTLGAFSQYGNNAKKLIQKIYDTNKSVVPSNIVAKLKIDWVATRWNPSSSEKASLISIINSSVGRKCQDEMFKEQVNETIKKAESLGITDAGCQIMYVEIAHLGGDSAAQRIFKKISKPYTVDKIFNTLMLDQQDYSNSNQVGDKLYQSRHECCVKWIKQYLPTISTNTNTTTSQKGSDVVSVTKEKAINAMIATAEAEIGYLEKASNSQLDSKTLNVGNNNYTKYWRDIYPSYQMQPWCACFVSWVFMKTFGQDVAKKLLKHWPYVYCPTMASLFALNSNPKKGDIVIFYRNGEFAHTGIVVGVNGDQFTTIEGNTSNGSTIIANGGGVCKKTYYNSNLPGTKFCTPDYSIVTKILTTTSTNTSSASKNKTVDSSASLSEVPKWKGKVNKASAPVRTWAGSDYKEVSFSPLKKNTEVEVCDTIQDNKKRDWYYIKFGDKFGFIYGSYITKITTAKKTTKTQYRVQTGAYSVYENARASTFTLQDAGFDAVVIKSGTLNIVQLGMFDSLANANALRDKAKEAGFDAVVIAVKV